MVVVSVDGGDGYILVVMVVDGSCGYDDCR